MPRIAAAAAIMLVAALCSSEAVAEASRGCAATIFVDTGGGKLDSVATIEGRGFCKNRFHAKTCRERARGAIVTCLRDLWAKRGRDGLPSTCTIFGGGRPWARLTWLAGPPPRLNSLTNRAMWFACCKLRPNAESLAYTIRAGIGGDKGCGSGFPMSSPTGLECSQLRQHGFCAPT
jgi:hypothetical protein